MDQITREEVGKAIVKYNGRHRSLESIKFKKRDKKILMRQLDLLQYTISPIALKKLTPEIRKEIAAVLNVKQSTVNHYIKANKTNGPLTTIAAILKIEQLTKAPTIKILITNIRTKALSPGRMQENKNRMVKL